MLNVKRAEGGIPEKAKVTFQVRVDGKEVSKGETEIDSKGNAEINFQLPSKIETGEGTLICIIDDSGVVETKTKTIPILLENMEINIYPEGGELVQGLECGVYVQAFNSIGDPADITANLIIKKEVKKEEKKEETKKEEDENEVIEEINDEEVVVSNFQTEHEGRGKFLFTPKKNTEYFLRIIKPSGMNVQFNIFN